MSTVDTTGEEVAEKDHLVIVVGVHHLYHILRERGEGARRGGENASVTVMVCEKKHAKKRRRDTQ